MDSGCSFEYISSGNSHIRVIFAEAHQDEDCLSWLKDKFGFLNTFSPYHKFGLLANAWTESNFGEIFQNYKPAINQIMLDSGGLQIVTQGMEVTDKIKDQVYNVQAKWADSAMCFDEIPLSMSGDKSIRTDVSQRWFDRSKHVDCATRTGKNVARQIEVFLEQGSTAKPFFIAQGNDLETYQEWTEVAMKQIPSSHRKYIAGVAMGSPALGFGIFEDIKKAFYFRELPIETNCMHILGAGSISRLLPFVILAQCGTYKDLHISYDSSTHSSGVNFGRYFLGAKNMNFPKEYDDAIYKKMYADIENNGFHPGVDVKHFHEALLMPSKEYEKKFGSRVPFIKMFNALFCSSVRNFITELDKCYADKTYLINTLGRKEKNIYLMLYKIKTIDDFRHWEREVGRHVASKAVGTSSRVETNIEDLF